MTTNTMAINNVSASELVAKIINKTVGSKIKAKLELKYHQQLKDLDIQFTGVYELTAYGTLQDGTKIEHIFVIWKS